MSEKEKISHTVYILFFAAIEGASSEQLFELIAHDLPPETDTLYIGLCTEGGSVSHGIATYNLLRGLPYKIIMHNIGNVDSIGNIVFLAGEERYAVENANFLLHHVSSTQGEDNKVSSHDLQEKLSSIQMDEKRINMIFKTRTKFHQDDLDALYTTGQLKDAGYALEKGLIQAVREIDIPADATVKIIKTSK